MKQILRIAVAAVIGLAVAGMILLARGADLLNGTRGILTLACLVVLVPLSQSLSRRLAIGGALLIGWLPLLWWFDLFDMTDRATWFLASAWGVFAFWIAVAARPVDRVKRLVPRFRWTDVLPLAAGASALWLYNPFFVSANDTTTLNLFMKSGWDHVAHFFMVSHLAASGSIQAADLQAPDGSPFMGSAYPRHFHVLTYAANEFTGRSAEYANGGINAYGEGTALVLISMTVVLTAALAQLPGLVVRPLLAWPLSALVIAAFLFGPGSASVAAGFPNFVLSCALVVVSACVAVSTPRVLVPLQVGAIGGLLVAIAHTWLLLVPLGVAAAFIAVIPFQRSRWCVGRVWTIASAAILAASAAAAFEAVVISASSLNGETLTVGGVEAFPTGLVALVSLGVLGLVAITFQRDARPGATSSRRASSSWLVIATALVILAGIAVQQLLATGSLTYYFSKFATSIALIGFGILCIVVAGLSSRTVASPAPRATRAVRVLGSALLVTAVMQLFGYVGPTLGGQISEQAAGLRYRSDSFILTSGESGEARRLTAAAGVRAERDWTPTVYFAPLPGDQQLRLANQWHLSMSGNWSLQSDTYGTVLDDMAIADWSDPVELARDVRTILSSDPEVVVLVDPDLRADIMDHVDDDDVDRVVSW